MQSVQVGRLGGLITTIDEGLSSLPDLGSFSAPGWQQRRQKRDAAVDRLIGEVERREQALVRQSGGATVLTIARLTASATAGREAALRNWRKAARARLDRERGELVDEVSL